MPDYFWCQLRAGEKHTCGYIEKRGAVVGKRLELVELAGDELWEVTRVSETGVSKEFVRSQERAFKSFQGSLNSGGVDA